MIEEPKNFILQVKFNNKSLKEIEKRRVEDCPDEYRVVSDLNADGGIIVFGRYGGKWVANPQTRHLISELMRNLKQCQKK